MNTTTVAFDGGWWALAFLTTLIAIGIGAVLHGRSKLPVLVDPPIRGGPPLPASSTPQPVVVTTFHKVGNGTNWIGFGIGAICLTIAIIALWWFFTGGANQMLVYTADGLTRAAFEPNRRSLNPVPVQVGQPQPVVVPIPEAGALPICAANSAKSYDINESDWSFPINVPAGCTPVFDSGTNGGPFMIEYKDAITGEWTPTGENYTAVRIRKQVSTQPCTMTVQVWFIPFKPEAKADE